MDKMTEVPDDAPLWRYMTFSKFVAMMSQRALYFSRADGFEDRFEGALGSLSDRNTVMSVWDETAEIIGRGFDAGASDAPEEPNEQGGHTFKIPLDGELYKKLVQITGGDGARLAELLSKKMRQGASEHFKKDYESTFICCWHWGKNESEAMWRLYSKDSAEGIAFQTTVGLLRESINLEKKMHIYRVEYMDGYVYDYSHAPLRQFVTKRTAFEHEKEVRALIIDSDAAAAGIRGLHVPVDCAMLIQQIAVSPYAPPWMVETVADVVRRFEISTKVTSSSLIGEALRY